MIFVPLPFVVALLLLLLGAVLLHTTERLRDNRAFLLVIGLSALQCILVGLRWGYHIGQLASLQAVVAACIPPLALVGFGQLVHHGAPGDNARGGATTWPHALAPALTIALLVLGRQWLDAWLIALFVGYAAALLRLGRAGPDGLDAARLDSAVAAHRALRISAAWLCLSALLDLAVHLDFARGQGQHAALIIGTAHLLGLLLLAVMVVIGARAKPPAEAAAAAVPAPPTPQDQPPEERAPAAQDQDVLVRIDRLLHEQGLFLDADLTLSRLARRAGIPARQISGAVNRLAGKNVSQYINDFRIAQACRLLGQGHSVTNAMLESGFQTKSNFNREFRRVTGQSPTAWRDAHPAASAPVSTTAPS